MTDFKREPTLLEKKDIFVLISQLVETCKQGIDAGQSRGMIIGFLIGSDLRKIERYTTEGAFNDDLEKCRRIAVEFLDANHPDSPSKESKNDG